MFLKDNFLQPTINFEPYFDKPLVSYWFIALLTSLNGGVVTEFLARLPSAFAGLATLWATRTIAFRLWDERSANAAGWILLTVYSFAFWGRLGEADMLNTAFSTLAVAWYALRREKTDFGSYLLFGLLCAVGAQTKGLGAAAVPGMLVLADVLLHRSWKRHLNGRLFAAGAVSLGFYLIPFLLAMAKSGDYSANGLNLVFQENIVRFFQAFDHKQPWYAYFIHLPQLFLPWTPFLVLAIAWGVRSWKKSGPEDRWLLISVAAIFTAFSLSDSKRVYYILPILPYCAILTGRFFLAADPEDILGKIRRILLKIYVWVFPAGIVLLLCGPLIGLAVRKLLPFRFPEDLLVFFMLLSVPAAAILAVIFFYFRKYVRPDSPWGAGVGTDFGICVFSLAVVFIAVFGIVIPVADAELRSEKRFFTEVRDILRKEGIPPERVAYYCRNYIDPTYYLGFPVKIRILDNETGGEEMRDTELRAFFEKYKGQKAVVIAQDRHFRKVPSEDLRKRISENTFLREASFPWESKNNRREKFILVTPEKISR
ncbi:MAG: Undecaprenyl phosphate-alpha-4-amino-4-deoxy-L-arabinose arabinosyl transferase [Lentisphaerae bacterium ADurb.Bin242]|nr:MAG: Undecaprenyl phosphate-alpha-4-amino-4-deoxy-L-arabinose arabinosyl transferase [Lentisphaerae bacterium ADurb.Bin242]